jgi:hypothetical protein
VKRPVRETDHSAPSSSDVKNPWSCTSTVSYSYVFVEWYLLFEHVSTSRVRGTASVSQNRGLNCVNAVCVASVPLAVLVRSLLITLLLLNAWDAVELSPLVLRPDLYHPLLIWAMRVEGGLAE